MRRMWRLTGLIVGLAMMSAAALAAPPAYRLSVDGLACPFCSYGIEKQLSEIDGVETIDVDIGSGTVTVTMTEGATLDQTTAERAVEAAGFSLGGFEPIATTATAKHGE